MMKNNHLYYASSPYHHLLCLSIAANRSEEATSHLLSSPNFTNSEEFLSALKGWDESPIDNVEIVKSMHNYSPPQVWLMQTRQVLMARKMAKSLVPSKVFVSKDIEAMPQSLLHYATNAERVYIEDGAAAYSLDSFNRNQNLMKASIRKLFYGYWYSKPGVIGGSGFIDSVSATFPEELRPSFDDLEKRGISNAFLKEMDVDWLIPFLDSCGVSYTDMKDIDILVLAAHSSVAEKSQNYKSAIVDRVKTELENGANVSVKYHPRDQNPDYLQFKEADIVRVPNSIPAEIVYLFANNLRTIIGTMSTALMTAQWMNIDAHVVSLSKVANIGDNRLIDVLNSIGVDVQS